MAAVAFDPLEYAHQLEASGVSREQAEVHAKAMTAMFLHNFDALVTKDYLDSRFNEFEMRVEAKMDKRFAEMESEMDRRFAAVDLRFERMEGKFTLLYWMQGIVVACVVIPLIRGFLG